MLYLAKEHKGQEEREELRWSKVQKRLRQMEDTLTDRINSINENILRAFQVRQKFENQANISSQVSIETNLKVMQQIRKEKESLQAATLQLKAKEKKMGQKQRSTTKYWWGLACFIMLILTVYKGRELNYKCVEHAHPVQKIEWVIGEMKEIEKVVRENISEREQDQIYMNTIYEIQNSNPEMLVNTATPFSTHFLITSNTLTLQSQIGQFGLMQQVLLTPVIRKPTFRMRVHIDTLSEGGMLAIGVVDQAASQARSSMRSVHAINYNNDGYIHYNKRNGYIFLDDEESREMKYSFKGGDKLEEGMQVVMEVDVGACTIKFGVFGGRSYQAESQDLWGNWEQKPPREYTIENDLLEEEGRNFVPYFQLSDKGDSISWEII